MPSQPVRGSQAESKAQYLLNIRSPISRLRVVDIVENFADCSLVGSRHGHDGLIREVTVGQEMSLSRYTDAIHPTNNVLSDCSSPQSTAGLDRLQILSLAMNRLSEAETHAAYL